MRSLLLAACVLLAAAAVRSAPEVISGGPFGEVTLYRTSPHPTHVVLFASGDGGWNKGVVDMARTLSEQDALVIGIDVARYLRHVAARREECSYFAADFEALSQQVQKKLGRPRYTSPVLVGYSSGATLVYSTLVQAPPQTFRAAISLGFCPDLPLARPACRGSGLESKRRSDGRGFDFQPAAHLETPWVALQGEVDQVCDATATRAFVERVAHAEIVLLPKVGHGFSVPRNWMPQFRAAFARVAVEDAAPPPSMADLPLIEVAAPGNGNGELLAVMISGDGGWAGLDREVAGALAGRGVPVVGLDSLRYFWTRRTPDEAGAALERVLDHYLTAWRRRRALLVGYSRGADVLPFMASRLPAHLLERVALVALIGPGQDAEFEFHVADWFVTPKRARALAVLPEIEKLRGQRLLCVYGREETESLCPTLPPGLATLDERPGAHHFGGNYRAIADRLFAEAARDSLLTK